MLYCTAAASGLAIVNYGCGCESCLFYCAVRRKAKQHYINNLAVIRRAKRYYLYRKFVATAYGHLGKGNRVHIPLCVVEGIRHAFREPGCKCARGGPLGSCTEHGYAGHRDAEAEESDADD